MPKDISAPLIMVGPGSGIAPFRGFWHHRRSQMKSLEPDAQKPGPMWLFFGCRHSDMELYKEEKEEALSDGVITNSFLALSRKTECKNVSYFLYYIFGNIIILTGNTVKYGSTRNINNPYDLQLIPLTEIRSRSNSRERSGDSKHVVR